MSLEALALDGHPDSIAADPVEGLIAACFDRAFLIFNLFVDDPRRCLSLTETVFRTLSGSQGLTEWAFYHELVTSVRGLPAKNEVLPGIAADSVLCWLLKDAAALSYAEIAELLTCDRSEVGERITEVRTALLS